MKKNKLITWQDIVFLAGIIVYCLLFISGHETVSAIYVSLIAGVDHAEVEVWLHWGSILVAAGIFLAGLSRSKVRWRFIVGGLIVGTLLWASDIMLICTNVERIHYVQYAILGFLVRSLINGDVPALLVCNWVGILDEFLQYALNPQYTKYLDFNDMILNLVGVVAGIFLWRCFAIRQPYPRSGVWGYRVATMAYGIPAILLAGVALAGRFIFSMPGKDIPSTIFPMVNGKMVFVLSYVDTTQFYLITGLGRSYHVMGFGEWIGLSVVIVGVPALMERFLPA